VPEPRRCTIEPTFILVIEDDEIVARTVERSLRGNEFRVVLTNSGIEGLKAARRRRPDLVILDVIMPGMDGYAVCREMRADPLLKEVPVLFLTAKVKDDDKIAGFMAGGDDYLPKPFNIDELILRIRAILRRARNQMEAQAITQNHVSPADNPTQPGAEKNGISAAGSPMLPTLTEIKSSAEPRHRLVVGEFILDTRSYELSTPTRGKIRLTPVQFDLLQHMMRHPGEIFSPTRLLDEVWDYPSDTGSPDLVRVHIKNLRERVEDDPHAPAFIRTVPGYGYTVSEANE
jgi:two-component system, OmpR family, response regulator RpaA